MADGERLERFRGDRPAVYGVRRIGPLLVLALLVSGLLISGCSSADADLSADAGLPTQRVEIGGRPFELELAVTPEARYQGLSDREEIADDGGMLFVFPEIGHLSFVMRRCLVLIDLIYLDGAGRVVRTHAMEVEPYSRPDWLLRHYRSGEPAQFAIELRGGMIEELGLRRGQRIELPLAELKGRAE